LPAGDQHRGAIQEPGPDVGADAVEEEADGEQEQAGADQTDLAEPSGQRVNQAALNQHGDHPDEREHMPVPCMLMPKASSVNSRKVTSSPENQNTTKK
jgi:hypothetical protein